MKFVKTLIFLALTWSANLALADFKEFNQQEFDNALRGQGTVVLDFHASWCPTCRAQEPLLREILTSERFANVMGFKANYDEVGDLKRSLRVTKQSTIVVFKNGKEVARKTGITSRDDIQKLIEAGL